MWEQIITGLIGGIAGGLVTVYVQKRLRRDEKVFSERGKVYQNIVENIWGFYAPKECLEVTEWEEALEAKIKFIHETRKAWLFAPEDVVRYVKDFLELDGATPRDNEEKEKLREILQGKKVALIKAMRKDLGIDTETDDDIYRVWVPSRKKKP